MACADTAELCAPVQGSCAQGQLRQKSLWQAGDAKSREADMAIWLPAWANPAPPWVRFSTNHASLLSKNCSSGVASVARTAGFAPAAQTIAQIIQAQRPVLHFPA